MPINLYCIIKVAFGRANKVSYAFKFPITFLYHNNAIAFQLRPQGGFPKEVTGMFPLLSNCAFSIWVLVWQQIWPQSVLIL